MTPDTVSQRAAQNPNFGLATKQFRAIDLSCRACGAGAGCWAWIPGRGTFGVEPPTSDSGMVALIYLASHLHDYA